MSTVSSGDTWAFSHLLTEVTRVVGGPGWSRRTVLFLKAPLHGAPCSLPPFHRPLSPLCFSRGFALLETPFSFHTLETSGQASPTPESEAQAGLPSHPVIPPQTAVLG